MIWCFSKNLANGSTAFIWKLCCHWLKGLQQWHNFGKTCPGLYWPYSINYIHTVWGGLWAMDLRTIYTSDMTPNVLPDNSLTKDSMENYHACTQQRNSANQSSWALHSPKCHPVLANKNICRAVTSTENGGRKTCVTCSILHKFWRHCMSYFWHQCSKVVK